MTDKEYDLVIIGGGSAGLTAASFAVQLGVRVAIVEKHRIGGDCTWTGCVPSKTLIKAAKVAHQMRHARRYGLTAAEPIVDLGVVMARVRQVIDEIYQEESPEALQAENVGIHLGAARFLDPHTLTAGEVTLKSRFFLIATGAHPYLPPIEGLDGVEYVTHENVWDLDILPQHLLVVGGGPVGCELSQAFQRLGSQVTLFVSHDRLLPKDDPAAAKVIGKVFAEEGIDVRFEARVERVWQDQSGIHVAAGWQKVVGDVLLVAAGRRPNVAGMDLEKAGVLYSAKGIEVNEDLRTSQKHIFAAGDCVGGPQFTHYAGWQAAMAVRNAFLPGNSKGISQQVPWTTFTDPEVAHVGLTEEQARQQYGDDVMICDWPMEQVDRARTEGDTAGFIKLVHRKNGTLLGATVVAGRAGEAIHEWIVALHHGLKVGDLSNAIHIYPTYSVASMQASAAIRVEGLLGGTTGHLLRGLARVMR